MAIDVLHRARAAKNDEFYTRLEDVEAEMAAYAAWNPGVFQNASVLLPCDDPDRSGFTKHFAENFGRYGLKRLVSVCMGSRHGRMLEMERTAGGGRTARRMNLKGNGDFRSPELAELRDEAGFIVTNPPFSLFREFMAWMQEGGKRFIVLGNLNAVVYGKIFPRLKEGEIWLGATRPKTFLAPGGDGAGRPVSFGNVCWFANVDHGMRHQEIPCRTMQENLAVPKVRNRLKLLCGEARYPKYDNYDAIEVPFVSAIPSDWQGVMGVPISYLCRHSPEQFEIVWQASGNTCANAPAGMLERLRFDASVRYGRRRVFGGGTAVVNGRGMFARILIRALHPES